MKIGNLRHITSVSNAITIAQTSNFSNGNSIGHYDGGMNFLSVLGENYNTHPLFRGAILVCTWEGEVSQPLRWDAPSVRSPNVLMDFNGSGAHFQNNDPRYHLPVGSAGLKLDQVIIDDHQQLVDLSATNASFLHRNLYEHGWVSKKLLTQTFDLLKDINEKARRGLISISVV